MKLAILAVLLVGAVLFSGCLGSVNEIGAINCGNDAKCMEDALAHCKVATGFQEIKNAPPVEKGRVDFKTSRVSDVNCLFSVTLSELSFQKDFVSSYTEQMFPKDFPIQPSDNYKKYLQNFSLFYVSQINSMLKENLPATIRCNAKITDGNTSVDDLRKCSQAQQNEITALFGKIGPKFIEGLKAKINDQITLSKEIALKLGELNEVDFVAGLDKTDLYSEGIVYVRTFVPKNVQANINSVDFDSFKVDYSVENLTENSFVVVSVIAVLEDTKKAEQFYKSAYNGFLSTQSSQKIKDSFYGANSNFVKIKVDPKYDSYRFIYQDNNKVVMIDLATNKVDLSKVVEKLKAIADTLNKRLNPSPSEINLKCEVKSTDEKVCETIQENQGYQENNCSKRNYSYQATDPAGTYSEGLFGYGCYTTVETTVSNQEDREGAFTFTVNFIDGQGNAITTMQDSKMISSSFPTNMSVTYNYDCKTPKPAHYTHSLQVPIADFCSLVTKTRQVPKEVCEQEQRQEITCK
jgi:hypothetical protein